MITRIVAAGLAAPILALASALALSGTAYADKAHDTLRLAVDQPIKLIDATQNPNPEANLIDRPVFDTLISYDVATKTYHGQLAESWTQIDSKTLEVKLRHGVKFSDGIEMTADDVVYSFQYATDPKNNFLFKDARFGWIDHVEKVDPYTVRVYSKEPSAIMPARLWGGPQIVPQHVRAQLADPTTFGLHPVGTGPYKVESFDPGTGNIVLVKNPNYNWGGYEPAGKIGRIEVTTIPDAQTRLAKVMVGDLDLVFHVDYDQAKAIVAQNPDYKIVVAPTISFDYIFFDSADRSGIHVFKDKRVREALLAAINVPGHAPGAAAAGIRGPAADADTVPAGACRLRHLGPAGRLRPGACQAALGRCRARGRLRSRAAVLGPGRSGRRSGRRRSAQNRCARQRQPRHGQCLPDRARRRQGADAGDAVGQWRRRARYRQHDAILLRAELAQLHRRQRPRAMDR